MTMNRKAFHDNLLSLLFGDDQNSLMRIGLVLRLHNPSVDPPSHFVSLKLAEALCRERINRVFTAIRVSKKIVHLQVDEPISEIKRRHKVSVTTLRPVPKLLPPRRPENLDLSYPARGFESCRHGHQAFVNACLAARGGA